MNCICIVLFQTASDSLKEITDAINYLEQTGIYIQNNKAELFDVTVDNVRYTVADENPIIYAGVACDGGFVAINGTCGKNTCMFIKPFVYQYNADEIICFTDFRMLIYLIQPSARD